MPVLVEVLARVLMEKKSAGEETQEFQPLPQELPKGISRRELVRRLATVMGAGTVMAAAPGAVSGAAPAVLVKPEAHSAPGHSMAAEPPGSTESQAEATGWKPAFLDAHQCQTFSVLAERILPGSTEAQVAPFVDLLLSVDTQENQKQFLNSLSAFEAYSLANYQQPFKNLSEEQQNRVLTVASTMESGQTRRHHGRRHSLGPAGQGQDQASVLTLRDHFESLKSSVSAAYFSSEPGMKYMGWTGQVMWTSFPGCQKSASQNE